MDNWFRRPTLWQTLICIPTSLRRSNVTFQFTRREKEKKALRSALSGPSSAPDVSTAPDWVPVFYQRNGQRKMLFQLLHRLIASMEIPFPFHGANFNRMFA